MNLTGILLAGGRSSRFRANKLELRNSSTPIFVEQIIKLSFFCSDIIIVTSISNYGIIAAELEKIESYFDFFQKNAGPYFKILEISGRNCVFPDKVPKIKLLVDEDFNNSEQGPVIIAASGLKKASKKDDKNSNTTANDIRNCAARGDHIGYRDIRKGDKKDFDKKYDCGKGDCIRKSGPILGIYTGLKNAPDYYSLVLASDMPFVSHRLLQLLVFFLKRNFTGTDKSGAQMTENFNSGGNPDFVEQCFTDVKKCRDIYVIKALKGFEVLCGIYSKFCINAMTENIKAGKNKISDIYNEVDTEILDEIVLQANGIDDLNFFNINTPKDYDDFINIWNSKTLRLNSAASSPNRREKILFAAIWAEFFLR